MKEFHVVFEGINGFQKEEGMQFPMDMPTPTLYRRDYERLSCCEPISLFSPRLPPGDILKVKDRCFRLRARLYALGKYIAYYTEEC